MEKLLLKTPNFLWPGAEPFSPPHCRNCLGNGPLSALLALGSPSSWISPRWGRRSLQLLPGPCVGSTSVAILTSTLAPCSESRAHFGFSGCLVKMLSGGFREQAGKEVQPIILGRTGSDLTPSQWGAQLETSEKLQNVKPEHGLPSARLGTEPDPPSVSFLCCSLQHQITLRNWARVGAHSPHQCKICFK